MSIRVRLMLWYGSLFALVLALVAVLSYAFHTRAHYDDLDRLLMTSVGHAADEAATELNPHLVASAGGLDVYLRLYGPQGELREQSSGGDPAPQTDPRAILAAPAGPPFDVVAGLAPPMLGAALLPPHGAFGLLDTNEQRWRAYVVPLVDQSVVQGYIEGLAPLGRLDMSVARLRSLLMALSALGLLAVLAGSWAVAGQALRPVGEMAQTARAIEQARDLSQRVPVPPQRDEVGELAVTFNEMLSSLEEASKAQQRFVADASHELRAPLTAIQGNLELLRRRPDMPPGEQQESLAEAEREAARLTRLVADLLALARADSGASVQHVPVDLDAVVLDALSSARSLMRGQALAVDTFEPAQVVGDADRLKQLFLILLDNALKYTPSGGQVSVRLSRTRDCATVTVCDTGVGIPAEALPHIFERFYRADPARARDPGGTGLGLPIAQWIVEQHGGALRVESTPGRGTTVSVRLPLVVETPA